MTHRAHGHVHHASHQHLSLAIIKGAVIGVLFGLLMVPMVLGICSAARHNIIAHTLIWSLTHPLQVENKY